MSKCIECENEIMLKYSALACDYDAALNKIRLLEEGLRVSRLLADMYARENEELGNKVKLYKLKFEKE